MKAAVDITVSTWFMIHAEDVLCSKMMYRNDFWNVPPPSFVQLNTTGTLL